MQVKLLPCSNPGPKFCSQQSIIDDLQQFIKLLLNPQDGSWHPVPKEDEEAKKKKKQEEEKENKDEVDLVDLSDDEGGEGKAAASKAEGEPATEASGSASEDEGGTIAPPAPPSNAEIECIDLE